MSHVLMLSFLLSGFAGANPGSPLQQLQPFYASKNRARDALFFIYLVSSYIFIFPLMSVKSYLNAIWHFINFSWGWSHLHVCGTFHLLYKLSISISKLFVSQFFSIRCLSFLTFLRILYIFRNQIFYSCKFEKSFQLWSQKYITFFLKYLNYCLLHLCF